MVTSEHDRVYKRHAIKHKKHGDWIRLKTSMDLIEVTFQSRSMCQNDKLKDLSGICYVIRLSSCIPMTNM